MVRIKYKHVSLQIDVEDLRRQFQMIKSPAEKVTFERKYRSFVMHYKIEWSSLDHNLRKEFNMLV